MLVVHDVLVKVTAEVAESLNHVINLHTVDQLSVVSQFRLDSVELSV
jgi:hypothetical protein